MSFADPVGRALMEGNVFRINHVSFDYEVYGKTLEDLGNQAHAKAREFYGAYPFHLSMSVVQVSETYIATVRSEIE